MKRWIDRASTGCRRRCRRGAILSGCLTVALAGCGQDRPPPETGGAEDAPQPAERVAERGPVKLTVRVDRQRISIADKIRLVIEVVAEKGIEINMPEFGEALRAFQIRDFNDRPAEPIGDRQRWRQEYTLDLFVSGTYIIPACTVSFTDRRKATTDGEGVITSEVSTEPITITVESLLAGAFDPADFRDIKGPVELPRQASSAWVWWLIGPAAGLAGLAALFLLLARRRRRSAPKIVVPPHEWAFDQLRLLVDERLVEQGRVHEFYFRLSDIVRVYIELRFALMAPERTTEEFLDDVRAGTILSTQHQQVLTDFLTACDQVKFARYQPGDVEIERAFSAARDFIEQSAARPRPEPVGAAA